MKSTSNEYFKEVAEQWDDLRKGFFPDYGYRMVLRSSSVIIIITP